jgi:DNA-binding transcriptional ArsR family regulator
MTADELDPLIHVPTRLKIVATLAALPDGDALSFTRLQDLIGLTPGNLIIHLRKLEEAGYVASEKTRNGAASKTTVTLTGTGRAALGAYTRALRDLLGGLDSDGRPAPADSDSVIF